MNLAAHCLFSYIGAVRISSANAVEVEPVVKARCCRVLTDAKRTAVEPDPRAAACCRRLCNEEKLSTDQFQNLETVIRNQKRSQSWFCERLSTLRKSRDNCGTPEITMNSTDLRALVPKLALAEQDVLER